jgi:carbon monoxide dehydrogenase subunit G
MQVKITKTFEVQQPAARVWEFLKDPRKVATCVPGAQITEALDDRRYAGTITVKVGPVVSDYKGELSIERLDEQNYEIELLGKGRDVKGKGSASMKMSGKLRALPGGGTEVTGISEITIIGLLAQFGSRMVEEVSGQMFAEFTAALQKNLQTTGNPGPAQGPPPSLSLLPLIATAITGLIKKFFRRLTRS